MKNLGLHRQIIWNRLIAACEEQAHSLIRSGFSLAAREANDVSAGVFDLTGAMIAQALTGTPGHINSMARSVRHFLDEYPIQTMKEGDSYITNDPWKGTGHLQDLVVCSPVFRNGKPIALFACTTHVTDIGGMGPTPEAKQVYAEGIFLPIMPVKSAAGMNELVLKIIRANVREPVQVIGDVYALVGCNEIGGRRLQQILDEYELDELDEVAEFIFATSREAMRAAINQLPKGTWHHSLTIDGFESPITLCAALTVGDGEILVDMEGTSGPSNFGINCPMAYTEAYGSYGIKLIVAPAIPNNAATLDCMKFTAPEGCIANASFPRAVIARATIGQMMPDLVFGCFRQAVPELVPAESTGSPWFIRFGAGQGLAGAGTGKIEPFMVSTFVGGGMGGRPMSDGLSTTAFPACIRSVSVELTESVTPLIYWQREYRKDSGGPGTHRGGMGQTLVIGNRLDHPVTFFPRFERVNNPARGAAGGLPGANGEVGLLNGAPLKPKAAQVIQPEDCVVVSTPGGGGHGDPALRRPEAVVKDVVDGFVSPSAAAEVYAVALTDGLQLDPEGTARLRASR